MKQINIGSSGLPARKGDAKSSRFSKSIALLGGVFMISLLCGKVNAQTALPTLGITTTQGTPTNINLCSPTEMGKTNTGWQSGTNEWIFTTSTTGYTGITMQYNTLASATGPHTGTIYYNTGSGVDSPLFVSYPIGSSTSSCTNTGLISFPVSCNNLATLTVKVMMSGASGSGGTNRVPNDVGFKASGSTGGCGALMAGTVSASPASVCGSGSSVLTLAGATGGSGISYQWQQSATGATGTYTNVGTNSVTFNTGTITATTHYRAYTACSLTGLADTTASITVTVVALPSAGTISNPLGAGAVIVGSTVTLTESGATIPGTWTNSNIAAATMSASGTSATFTGVAGGTTLASYKVTDLTTGCSNTSTATVNVAWPNTLALYEGTGGNSTGTIHIANDTALPLKVTGFGTTTPCTSGGYSGLTVPVSITSYDSTNPHVSYTIKPTGPHALTVTRIAVTTRESGTGPTKARLAYFYNNKWHDEGRDVAQTTGGSCGANSNSWDYNTPGGDVTINGITDSIIVAVFPYAPGASTGTFQVNSLEVYGLVTSSTPCSTITGENGGYITPVVSNICDSGSRIISIDTGSFSGIAGVGISYQWQTRTSLTGTFMDIAGANNITYNTGELHSGVAASTNYYQLVTKCTDGTSTHTVDTALVNVNPTPIPTAITGVANHDTIRVGDVINLGATGSNIFWSSNDTSAISIGRTNGIITGNLPGYATITRLDSVAGCFGTVKDTLAVVYPNTIAAYLGTGGTSTNVSPFSGNATPSTLSQTGYGVATPCGSGGLSGLTNNGSTAYDPAGPVASFTLNPVAGGTLGVQNFHTTLRMSASGIQNVRLAYMIDGDGTWFDDLTDHAVDFDDCGYSHSDVSFAGGFPSLGLGPDDFLTFGIFGYNPIATGGTLQINTTDIVGCAYSPIFDADHSHIFDGKTYGAGCTVQLSCTPAGGVWSVSSAHGDVTITAGGQIHFPATTAGGTEGVAVNYTVSGCDPATANATLNTSSMICTGSRAAVASNVANVNNAASIKVFPNPVSTMLNISSKEAVNVVVLSMDGKKLIEQNNATSINVASLASGVYMVQMYNADNTLVKTVKFTKE